MIRLICLALAALWIAYSPANAQVSQSVLQAQVTNTLPDNTTGAITPLVMRNMFNALVLSTTCATQNQIIYWNSSLVPVCSSSPIIGTQITVPLVIGGTSASSTLTLESTSGVGTSDAIIFNTGSQVERARIASIGNFDIGTSINAQTGTTYTVLSTDNRKLITGTNAAGQAYSLPQATGSFTTGWSSVICSYGAGTVTVSPITSNWNGASSQAIPSLDCYHAASDGTNYQGFDLGLYTRNKGDLSLVSANFSLLGSGLGNQTNVTGNGTVSAANYFSPFSVINNYPSTHTGAAVAAGSFSILGPGSGAAGGSGDVALTLSSSQLNYLTNSTAGENDGLIAFIHGGVNSTGNPITAHIEKRANGSSQVAVQGQAIETQADLVNGSGIGAGTLARVHSQTNQLDVANAKYGFGSVVEAQVGAWDTGFLTDTIDQSSGTAGSAPSWNYLLRGRTARTDSNQYFAVTGAGHSSGSGRIASGVAASTITARAQFNNNAAAPSTAEAGVILYGIGADASNAGFELAAYGAGNFPFISLMKSGGTLASRSAILSGNSIGQFQFGGYDGTNFDQTGVLVSAGATENWNNTSHGSALDVYTTPSTTTATALAARFNPSGGFGVGDTTDPGIGVVRALNGFITGTAATTLTLKQGANGATGTLTCVSASNVTVSNTYAAAGDGIFFTWVSGTGAATIPTVNTFAASTSFRVACASGDTAVYRYTIIKSAA